MTPLITDLAIVAVICLAGWGVEKIWKWNRRRQHRRDMLALANMYEGMPNEIRMALEARDEHE